MKRTIICAVLSLGLAAMPMTSFAHGYHGYHGYGGWHHSYNHGGYHHGGGFGNVLLPLIAGAAVIGAFASIASEPRYEAPAPVYYGPPPVYEYAPSPVYNYAPPPAYGYAPRVCTYYPDGAEVCR